MRLSERDIFDRLQTMRAKYAPLIFVSIRRDLPIDKLRADALIQLQISSGPSFEALAEITSLASPKSIYTKAMQVLDLVRRTGNSRLVPLLIAPYVAPKQADTLAEAGVSWLDLSGNMVIRVSGHVYVERTGRPNQFPDTAPIRKVFQGTASLVPRALLLNPVGFASLSELADFINNRDATIAMSTVSKVLRSLEENLLVAREGSRISVVDRRKLLDRLAEGYASSSKRQSLKVHKFALEKTGQILRDFYSRLGAAYVLCGFYAAELKGLAASTQITMYVSDMTRWEETAASFPSDLLPDQDFGQLQVVETKDRTPWFNAQTVNGTRVVDDLELYLEMMVDTPRGPKVADTLRPRILGTAAHG